LKIGFESEHILWNHDHVLPCILCTCFCQWSFSGNCNKNRKIPPLQDLVWGFLMLLSQHATEQNGMIFRFAETVLFILSWLSYVAILLKFYLRGHIFYRHCCSEVILWFFIFGNNPIRFNL